MNQCDDECFLSEHACLLPPTTEACMLAPQSQRRLVQLEADHEHREAEAVSVAEQRCCVLTPLYLRPHTVSLHVKRKYNTRMRQGSIFACVVDWCSCKERLEATLRKQSDRLSVARSRVSKVNEYLSSVVYVGITDTNSEKFKQANKCTRDVFDVEKWLKKNRNRRRF